MIPGRQNAYQFLEGCGWSTLLTGTWQFDGGAQSSGSAWPDHIGQFYVIVICDFALNIFDTHPALGVSKRIGQTILGKLQGHISVYERGKRNQSCQCSFKNTHIRGYASRKKLQNVIIYFREG